MKSFGERGAGQVGWDKAGGEPKRTDNEFARVLMSRGRESGHQALDKVTHEIRVGAGCSSR